MIKLNDTDFNFYDSQFENLDQELEIAKENPFKVRLEYDRRFRVWNESILLNRRVNLDKLVTDREALLDLAHRYVLLDINDVARLYRRAEKEFFKEANDPDISQYLLNFYQSDFRYRQKMLVLTLHKQLKAYENVTGLDIIDQIIGDAMDTPTADEASVKGLELLHEMREYYIRKQKRGE